MGGPQEKIPATGGRTARKLGCWGKLGIIVLVLIILEGALQIVFQYQRRCPPVSGLIVDRDTGKPIAGALVTRNMLGRSRNPIYGLAGSSGPGALLPFTLARSDGQGEFSFPSAKTMMRPLQSGDPFIYLYGPDVREGLEVIVYAPDYIPARSHEEGFAWEKEQWLTMDVQKTKTSKDPKWQIYGPTGFAVSRKGSLRKGYTYRIEMVKAVTEGQWEEKCNATVMLASKYMWGYIANQWLFNDLAGYLERWPEGEKAGEYLRKLIEMAWPIAKGEEAYCYSNPRLETTKEELELALEANRKVQELLPRIDLSREYEADPLFQKEMGRYLPDGFKEGDKYIVWLLKKKGAGK